MTRQGQGSKAERSGVLAWARLRGKVYEGREGVNSKETSKEQRALSGGLSSAEARPERRGHARGRARLKILPVRSFVCTCPEADPDALPGTGLHVLVVYPSIAAVPVAERRGGRYLVER